ncbi:MAG: energy transducer TonB [Janthinobacterium lividum]
MLPTNPLLHATAPAGPHLPLAMLRQYAAGTLAPAVQHRVEAHALACPRCADVLEGLLQTPPATTDQALAQLQQRLRRRVQQPAAALPAVRTRHRHRLVALQLAAAATLLFGLVAGGWWTWQQRHNSPDVAARPATPRPTAVTTAPAAEVPTALAPPARSAVSAVVAARIIGPHAAPRRMAPLAVTHLAAPAAAPDSLAAPVAYSAASAAASHQVLAEVAVAPVPATAHALTASRAATYDSSVTLAPGLLGRTAGVAVRANAPEPAPALVRATAMPAGPAIPPAPVGGYGSWREKVRREAAEFKPELPEQPLSGTVQLRLLVGADGKIEDVRVVHGLRADYDAEAQRLVCDGANWVPGIGGGKRAAQPVEVAVPFQ